MSPEVTEYDEHVYFAYLEVKIKLRALRAVTSPFKIAASRLLNGISREQGSRVEKSTSSLGT
jgi:hypothetical protein